MAHAEQTIEVAVDHDARRLIEKAAALRDQSAADFLQEIGAITAHRIVLDWAVAQFRAESATLSELADQTGLAVEEIMIETGRTGHEEALDTFLSACESLFGERGNVELMQMARRAVEHIRREE